MRRIRNYPVILGVLALVAIFVAPGAFAQHFEEGSMKVCGPLIAGQVDCTLTITIEDDFANGVFEGDDIIVTLAAGTTGATFADADVVSGCGGAAVSVDSTTQLSVDPTLSPVDDCTIVVSEVLNATTDGEVCQTLDNMANDPPITVCADIVSPTDPEVDCKKGAWEDWGIFKNQGDCVSYIATQGKNEPGQNVPGAP
jgi:hypothetical protein